MASHGLTVNPLTAVPDRSEMAVGPRRGASTGGAGKMVSAGTPARSDEWHSKNTFKNGAKIAPSSTQMTINA
jgi:hypothetical protein